MKKYRKIFRSIAAALSLTVLIGSVNAFIPAVSANAQDSTSSSSSDTQTDVSLVIETRKNVIQVQELAAGLYDENIDKFGSRNGGFSWDTEGKKHSWTYYNGIMMDAYLMLDDCLSTGEPSFYNAVNSFYDANISYADSAATVDSTGNKDNYYRETELDSIPPVRALFDLLKSDILTEDECEKYTQLILYVYDLMSKEYPTVEGTNGNFKHKYGSSNSNWSTYPIALDGLYMAQPFFMELANAVEDGAIDGTESGIVPDELYADVAARVCWIGENLYDPETGLYNHGWGAEAGVNGQYWLRAVGWYAAALTDVICMLPEHFEAERNKLIAVETQLFEGMMKYQDSETGMWYNVIDRDGTLKGSKSANLLESSGSALIAYAMLRAYSEGYADETFCKAGLRAFNGTVENQLDSSGLHNIYISSGVGTTAESYLSKSYQVNEAKGVAPLMMAACFAGKAAERCYGTIPEVQGDINADGEFAVSDVVLLQKWLLAVPGTHLANWKAADFCDDNWLDVFDLCLMKRVLLKQNQE
ncbi:MAG: glycoside hydrolase family 88 protein [Ruminococcus sp.]|nr:glycoside hydrolase family 88 protein [Ruminococcus sp.]